MESGIIITIQRMKDLQSAARQQVDMLTHQEFAHLDLVRRYRWAEPDWMAIARRGREIVSFVGIISKNVMIDTEQIKIGGLSNAVTPKEHRGRGYATAVLNELYPFMFNELKAEHGLLLCRDHLIGYYQKNGWYRVDCPLEFNKQDGTKTVWPANTMLYTPSEQQLSPTAIDLRGFPW